MRRCRNEGAPQAARRARSERGYVLVSLLWILATLALAVSAMSVFTVNSLSVVSTSLDKVRIDGMFRAGVEYGALQIMNAASEQATAGQAELRLGEGRLRMIWRGEAGKIDLNAGSTDMIAALLVRMGADETQALAYKQAAEARRTGAPAPFQHLGELVEAGAPELLISRLAPYVTVYGNGGTIDPRLASREVLSLLPGMTEARLRGLIALRDAGSTDRNAWSEQAGEASSLLGFARSASVRIRVDVLLDNGMSSAIEVVIVLFGDDAEPYRILSWEDLSSGRATSGLDGELH